MITLMRYPLLFMLLCFVSCKAYYIPTGTMEDTLQIGDHMFVTLVARYAPERGDLVIFIPPHEKEKEYVKRVIAIPGDRFDIKDDGVFINDTKLIEPYAKGITKKSAFNADASSDIYAKAVPENKLVVLGDNREHSLDSRYFGYIDIRDVKAKPFLLYWNTRDVMNHDFSRLGFIKLKKGR